MILKSLLDVASVYKYTTVICIGLLYSQNVNKINLISYLYKKKYHVDECQLDRATLESEILELKKELSFVKKYQELYDKMSNNLTIVSLLEVYFYNKDQNEKYVIAKSNNKVDINDIVVDNHRFLIGRVIYATKSNTVKVQTIDDEKSFIPAIVNDIDGVIIGTNNDKCRIEFILLDDSNSNRVKINKVGNDALVLTSGKEHYTPKGIIIGKINKINEKYCVTSNVDKFDKLAVVKNKE